MDVLGGSGRFLGLLGGFLGRLGGFLGHLRAIWRRLKASWGAERCQVGLQEGGAPVHECSAGTVLAVLGGSLLGYSTEESGRDPEYSRQIQEYP